MKKLILLLAAALLAASFILPAIAAPHEFPKGSPKFLTDYKAAIEQSKKEGKPAILVFSAAWCPPCQTMKKSVYPSKEVAALHDKFVWAYLDVDEDANSKAAQQYAVQGIPHVQFVDPSGKDLGNQVGSTTPGDFAGTLNKVLKKAAK
ncbi:MAG: thioredoxin family protein [Prosthecobacter sp.]|nr:thioredoxin family protein [Prosthecobacter sp.]